ncbi:Phage gp6-like head-tail connector protein [Clostridium cadaveris]|uniref:Phage gp6-like head-tail connector protein n=1 Tax=Clostridium cadaveris TaxID=1529 RepID=A0A1I2NUV2_9CLOT|nr:phage head-tail connector protein [Clostridium cadaveris]MDM8312838.1 phage head-tail connector protein [Clostridium cadaveris]SFG05216.1 Phage gp6-like head-tail connector protein [Clostridium cadaveris]
MTQLEKLKVRLPEVEDALLNQLLEDAEIEILDYCNRDILLTKMEGLQRELAIIYYNRQGSEGEASRSELGVSVSYITDIPDNIKSRLNAFRRLKAVGVANANKE